MASAGRLARLIASAVVGLVAVAIVVAPLEPYGWNWIANVIGITNARQLIFINMRIENSELDTPGAGTATGTGRMTREQSRANTRDRLLAAARSVFARSGFHGASVEEIASEAGFSTGALYSNFTGKEDLFLVLMEREIDEHAREISEAVRERASIAE